MNILDQVLNSRRTFLRKVGVAIAVPGLSGIATAAGLKDAGHMPELDGAVGWLNSPPLGRKALAGKVALFNFWTYSCINSLRELPYMKAWAAKYKDAGLVVVGVHSPEFDFKKDRANVENAVSDLKVTYPVPIDSNRAIWRAFRNQYWPADYFVDAQGRVRYHHFGEGDYAQSERMIQTLLRECGAKNVGESLVRIAADGPEAPPSEDVLSPETYAGYARMENFASPERMARDVSKTYSLPARLGLNHWGLDGLWNVAAESAMLVTAPGKIVFRFHSRDLHMVLGPAKKGMPVRFRVKLNGSAPGDERGADSGSDGMGEVRGPRMYQLIRQKGLIKEVTFEMEFIDPVEAFSFTFG